MKRLFSIFLTFGLLFMLSLALGEDHQEYTYDETAGILTITGEGVLARVPSSYPYSEANTIIISEGFTGLSDSCLQNYTRVTRLELPGSLREIGSTIFGPNTPQLRSVVIPEGLTIVKDRAFEDCILLKEITLPSTLTSISAHAFTGCRNLQAINIRGEMDEGMFCSLDGVLCRWINNGASLQIVCCPQSFLPDEEGMIILYGPVTRIAPYAFQQLNASGVSLFNTAVEEIGEYAFYKAGKLQHIQLPSTLKTVKSNAFLGCKPTFIFVESIASWMNIDFANEEAHPNRTTSVMLDDVSKLSVLVVDESAVSSVEIPDGITRIKPYTFSGMNLIQSVALPDSVTAIDEKAFAYCTSLSSILFGKGIKNIASDAFAETTLQSIDVPDLAVWLGIETDNRPNAQTYPRTLTINGKELTSVVIPDGVTEIPDYCFANFTNITSLTINGAVTRIDQSAFTRCSGLTTVSIKTPGSITIEQNAFEEDAALTSVSIQAGEPSTIGSHAFYSCKALKNLTLAGEITSIDRYAFGYSSITSLVLPDSVESIEDAAFYHCSQLQSISFGNHLQKVGSSAFRSCSALKTVQLPETVTEIGLSAFQECSALTSFVFPAQVTVITEGILRRCTSLQSVTLPPQAVSIEGYAFDHCKALTVVDIPASVKSIGNNAFSYCSLLQKADLPGGLTMIGVECFKECGKLKQILIPEGIEIIPSMCFDGCYELKTVILPASLKTIGFAAFRSLTALSDLSLPDGLTTIGEQGLRGCSSLIKLEIPSSVTTIEAYAFQYSKKLSTVTFHEGLLSIGKEAFLGCTSLAELTLPSSLTRIPIDLCGSLQSISFECEQMNVDLFSRLTVTPVLVFKPYFENMALTRVFNARSISWQSYPSSVVQIDAKGEFTALHEGEARITASFGGKTAYLNLSVMSTVTEQGITVPARVKSIPANAFNSSAARVITLSSGVTSIDQLAFANNSQLLAVVIPDSVTFIDDTAFLNCPTDLMIVCSAGSTAEHYANIHGFCVLYR